MVDVARFKTEFRTIDYGYKWKIELWDTDWHESTTANVKCTPDTKLSYESQNDTRYAAIKGSSLELPLLVENSLLENWLFNNIQQAQEERFYAHVYIDKGSGYVLNWVGVLLHDLNEREDAAYPYVYTLKFTDGLARLKDLKFAEIADPTNSLSYTPQTLNWFIYQCLSNTPFYFRVLSTAKLYSNSVNFYEYNMVTSGTHWSTNVDPLDESTIYPKGFCNTLSNGQLEGFTFYDILEQILTLFNARIILSDGYFKIISLPNYANSSWKERTYLADGTFDAQRTVNWDTNINQTTSWAISASNKWQYFPAIKSVYRKFNTNNDTLVYPTSNIFNNNFNPYHAGDISGSKQLQFSSKITNKLVKRTSTTQIYNTFYKTQFITIQFNVGIYYLKNNLNTGALSWTTNSSDRYILEIPIMPVYIVSPIEFDINIITPILPNGLHTNATIIVTNVGIFDASLTSSQALTQDTNFWEGTYPVSLLDLSFEYNADSTILRFYNDSNAQNYISYQVDNSSSLINSKDIDLLESYLGDNDKGTNGALYTGSKYAPLISTAQWKTDGGGTAYDINELLCKEVIAAQLIPCPRYQGGILTNGRPQDRYTYLGDTYILNGGDYNLESMQWDGEFFKIYRDITNINTHGGNPIEQGQGETGPISSNTTGIRNNQRAIGYYNSERVIGVVTDTISGTLADIQASVLRNLKSGDKLIIIPTYSSEIVECQLNADCNIGDSVIHIVSQAFSNDIPSGSLIFVPLNKPVLNTLRIEGLAKMGTAIDVSNLPTSDPGIVGLLWKSGDTLKIST
jgi:hypothetical protein